MSPLPRARGHGWQRARRSSLPLSLGLYCLHSGDVNDADRTLSFFTRRNPIDLDHPSLSMESKGRSQLVAVVHPSTLGGRVWVMSGFQL